MTTSPVIRPAQAADVPALVELLRLGALAADKEDPNALERYNDALAEIAADPRGGAVLVAELDGTVVGVCQLILFRHLQERGGRCAEIESMHTHPAWRGRGIGGTLLDAAVELARTAGCYRVQLTSNTARPDAHRFYERHGFAPTHVGFKRRLDGAPP
jgi:GNAT superfamily N-acetyltransferase